MSGARKSGLLGERAHVAVGGPGRRRLGSLLVDMVVAKSYGFSFAGGRCRLPLIKAPGIPVRELRKWVV
jgi:hypothetical protein